MKKTICFSCIILCIALIAGAAASFITFFTGNQSLTTVSTSVELIFDGASDGKDPNGTSYRFDRIVSAERLGYALEKAAVSTDCDISDIIPCITVSESYLSENFPKSTEFSTLLDNDAYVTIINYGFIATKYGFSINNSFDRSLGADELKSILSELIAKIRDDFCRDYSHKFNGEILDDYFDFSTYDYTQKVDILTDSVNQIEAVATYMNELVPEFSVNNVSFGEIVEQSNSLKSIFVNQLGINVNVNSICVSKSELISNYEYYIKSIDLSIEKYTKELAYISSVLASYERDDTLYISSGNSLTKIESNSGETYEALVSKKIELNFEIAEYNTRKNNYLQKIENLKNKSEENITAKDIDEDIEDIKERLSKLYEGLNSMLSAYNEQYVTNNSIVQSEFSVSRGLVFSVGFIVNAIKCTGPFMVIAIVIVLALFMKLEVVKFKKKNA